MGRIRKWSQQPPDQNCIDWSQLLLVPSPHPHLPQYPAMADKVDYYSVLGCDPSSSEEQIRTEFRLRARQSHPDKDGNKEEFQVLQEAKDTLLDRARRTLYDKWRASGLEISYSQWESLKETVQTSMHWASPRTERTIPEGQENKENTASSQDQEQGAEPGGRLRRQDSCHPTIVMVNKCNQEELRR